MSIGGNLSKIQNMERFGEVSFFLGRFSYLLKTDILHFFVFQLNTHNIAVSLL